MVGQRLDPDERRRHLLDVAKQMVEAEGSAAATMGAVAQRAGVSRGLVYSYFSNRRGLLTALWHDVETTWGVEPMSPPEELLVSYSSPRALFEARLVENTKWYLDKIEQIGLLHHRLLAEPQIEPSIEAMRRRIQNDNVEWWARLLQLMGVDAPRAFVFSSILNGATGVMWQMVASGVVERSVIEEVFLLCGTSALDELLDRIAAS